MRRRLIDRFPGIRASWVAAAFACAVAGVSRPALAQERAQEHDALQPLVQRITELGRKVESELDVERNVAEARDRWSLSGAKLERMQSLLARFAKRNAIDLTSDRGERLQEIEAQATELFGERQGREVSAWLQEKEAAIQAIGDQMRHLGAEISREATKRAARALERTDDARKLAETVRKQALEQARDALGRAHADLDRVEMGRVIPGERLDEVVREALERAQTVEKSSLDKALRALNSQKDLKARLQAAQRALEEFQTAQNAARDSAHKQAIDLSADALRRLADEARRSASRRSSRDVDTDPDAWKRAAELREEMRVRLREELERRRAELDRTRDAVEELRRKLQDLDVAASQPKRSRKI